MRDPAMLWYWDNWYSGTQLLSRFLKGCYMDLLHAQFNNGHLSLEEIKTCLGSDFGQSWPTLQKKFTRDENGMFFNERTELEKNRRAKFVESRSNNKSGRKKSYDKSHDKHMINHMGDGNGNLSLGEDKEGPGEKEGDISFDTFWDLYDKKEDRLKCEKKWGSIAKRERERILEVLPAYIISKPDKKFRKNPLTWLNGKCWQDEILVQKSIRRNNVPEEMNKW